MKTLKIFFILLISTGTSVRADFVPLEYKALDKIAEKTSNFVSGLIPGEGLTEVDINLRDSNFLRGRREGNNNFQFSILGVRDVLSKENSNEIVLLDARERAEYEVSHLYNARWIGFEDFNESRLAGLSKNQEIGG